MRKVWLTILALSFPLLILVAVIARHETVYQGKTVVVWFQEVKMQQESPALDAMKALGKSAVPALKTALRSEQIGNRFKAAWILGQLGPVANDAVPDLLRCFDDADMIVRANAIRAVALIDPEREGLVPILMAKLADPKDPVSASAADFLNKIEQLKKGKNLPIAADEFEYTMAFVHSPSLRIKFSGVNRLGKLPSSDDRVVPALQALTLDTNISVRQTAENLLANKRVAEARQAQSPPAVTSPVGPSK